MSNEVVLLFVRGIIYGALFWLGRYSIIFVKNQELEKKRKELMHYRDALLAIEADLEQKDAAIRQKWQEMVDDFSKYNSYAMKQAGQYKLEWTQWDDQYLESWSSAEE